MEKTVTISVKAKQEMGDGPADSMELVTQGVLQRDGDTACFDGAGVPRRKEHDDPP